MLYFAFAIMNFTPPLDLVFTENHPDVTCTSLISCITNHQGSMHIDNGYYKKDNGLATKQIFA